MREGDAEGTIVCVRCGRSGRIASDLLRRLRALAAESMDARLVYTAIILFGVCAGCRRTAVHSS